MEMECILTGITIDYKNGSDTIHYDLKISDNTVEIFICRGCKDKIKPHNKQHIIRSLISNNNWPKRSFINSYDCTVIPPKDSERILLPDYFEIIGYPKTPSEKLNSLFLYLYNLQKFDGELISINILDANLWIQNYFANRDEFYFYLNELKVSNLILFETAHLFKVTHKGLNKVVELLEEGDKSKNCFVAMAFDDSMKPYRDAIKKALITTGYTPIIIDEEHLNSDKTIPDGILSGIKKSKFCVADFTMHRNGVYFESGYALGLGKPVIYLCRKDEFENAHFDIKQLQHIIYSSDEELEKRLIEKIEVWIK